MIIIIVLVLVFLVLGGGIIYFYQKNNTLIDQVSENLEQLIQLQLGEQLTQIKKQKLAGLSLEKYQAYQTQYQNLTEKQLPQEQEKLLAASEQNISFRVLTAYRSLQKLAQEVQKQLKLIAKIQAGLDVLSQSLIQVQTDLTQLQKQVSLFKKQLVENSLFMAPLKVALESKLQPIVVQLQKATALVEQGNPLTAQELLKNLQKDFHNLQKLYERTLQRQERLQAEFNPQLEELERVDKKLKGLGMQLPNPQIPLELQTIRSQIKQLESLLLKLQLAHFDRLEKEILQHLDQLYDRIASEWRLKKKVRVGQPILGDFLQHAQAQGRRLAQEMVRLRQQYVLKLADQERAQTCQQQLIEIQAVYQQQLKYLKAPQVIYSQVWQQFQKMNRNLTQIETQQQQIQEHLGALKVGYQDLQQQTQALIQELDRLQRKLVLLHLPGLPSQYQVQYREAEQKVQRLQAQLGQDPVDVFKLQEQCTKAQKLLTVLTATNRQLIEDIQTTSLLLQYANRYINDLPEVKQAAQKAQQVCEQEHDYHQARQIIAQALDQAEPGAVERIQKLQQNEVQP
ncbi:hypothetical protein HU830_00330 [Lactobacillus sp. DCY120]|uniref:Septation ring formation regulator EzrA n=1 Tax=Bombilactobacillus apium TaxID=2675299 RepID=A0A850R546_9LACO|nr:septation ring formation regulator EzrA [Bombilactobacillus apium]NVY95655.1 hypothetical protein [Bombilactobacillus apium]